MLGFPPFQSKVFSAALRSTSYLGLLAVLAGCEVSAIDGWDDGSGGGFVSSGTTSSSKAGTSGTGFGAATGTGGGVGPGGGPSTPAPIAQPPDDPPVGCSELDPDAPAILYLSADDSNSMASPVVAREALHNGSWPSSVRVYEFLNYYHVDYPAPLAPDVGIYLDAAPGADPADITLQIGVRSYHGARRPMTLTFVLDTSGSMGGAGIERERAAVLALASQLAVGDVVNMVTWNTANLYVLSNHAATGPNDPSVVAAAQALTANGGTDLDGGLSAGYALASQTYDPTRLNRLVLISDGGANVGVTAAELIAQQSALGDDEGIYLLGVGAGPQSNYSDALMDTVTDKGRGAYVYLDDPAEAPKIFGQRFSESLEVAARGVQVELTLPWYMQMQHFSGEEYSTDPNEVKPQHLAPDDAMVFMQTLHACDASVIQPNDPIAVTVTWQVPVTHEQKSLTKNTTIAEILAGDAHRLAKGQAVVAYAEALRSKTAADVQTAQAKVTAAKAFGPDGELDEIESLLAAAALLAQ